jgi:hypothetical protein
MEFDAALTAWATLGLAALAVVAAVFALLAWKAQGDQLSLLRGQLRTLQGQLNSQKQVNEKQLPVLEGQRAELEASRHEREDEARQRREAYVSRVFAWHEIDPSAALSQAQGAAGVKGGKISRIFVRNTAEVPVYDVAMIWRVGGQIRSLGKVDIPLMPGDDPAFGHQAMRGWGIPDGVNPEDIKVAVFIRDASQGRWRIQPDGRYDPYEETMLPAGVWR